MRYYNKILIWENKRRLNKLREFRSLMIRYFNNSRIGFGGGRVEESAAKEAKRDLNRLREEIHSIILNSEMDPSFSWTRPAAAGGDDMEIDLIENLFNLDQFDIGPSNVLGIIDKTIGQHDSNRKSAFIRTLNPFFYIGVVLDTISDLPFIFVGLFGFNRKKIRTSAIGRPIKAILYLTTIIAALLAILHFSGFLEPTSRYISKLLGLIREINLVFDPDSVK